MSLNPPILEWRGKRVWLVGASTGIGRALAERLHALGATVIVSARNAQALQSIAQAHAGMRALPLDVGDAGAVRQAAQALEADGGIDAVGGLAGFVEQGGEGVVERLLAPVGDQHLARGDLVAGVPKRLHRHRLAERGQAAH